jgi:hypothetical protein
MSVKGQWKRRSAPHLTLEIKDLRHDLAMGSPEQKTKARARLIELDQLDESFVLPSEGSDV